MDVDESVRIEARCAVACTRAGVTALLIAVFGISLVGTVNDWRASNSLQVYISLRMQLKTAINVLTENPCWRDLLSQSGTHESPLKWNLKKLSEIECKRVYMPPKPQKPAKTSRAENNSKANSAVPNAPTGLNIPQIEVIIKDFLRSAQILSGTLRMLSGDKILEDARSASAIYDHSIYKWTVFRNRLLAYQSDYPRSLEMLSVENIIELSKYDYPDAGGPVMVGPTEVTLFPASARVGVVLAVNLVEVALLVLYLYFWLFQREARACETFPTRGTLFGVFYRDRFSKMCFVALILTPAFSGGYLAWASFYATYLPSVVATLTVLLAIFTVVPHARALLISARESEDGLPHVT